MPSEPSPAHSASTALYAWCDDGDSDFLTTIRTDPAAGDALVKAMRFESLLRSEICRAQPAAQTSRRAGARRTRPRRVARRQPRAARHRRFVPALLAVAAVLAAVISITVTRPETHSPVPRLDGQRVQVDTWFTPATAATLTWDDGSQASIAADSRLLVRSDGAVALDRGVVTATVAPHAAEQPFTVVTAEGGLTVLGTVFTVGRTDTSTRLDVSRGRVRLHTQAGATAVVPAGGSGIIDAFGSLLDHPQEGPIAWRPQDTDLVSGQRSSERTLFGDPILKASAPASVDNEPVFGLQWRGDLFTWDDGAELCFDYTTDGGVPWLGIWLQNPTARGPNYFRNLPLPPPGQWRSLRIPLASIPANDQSPARPDASQPMHWLFFQAGFVREGSLYVANVRVVQPTRSP